MCEISVFERNMFHLWLLHGKRGLNQNATHWGRILRGAMFETYGNEVAFVKEQDGSYIWTYGDGDDGGSYVWNGWSFVNRIGYFITEVPCPADTTIQIKVSSYWYYCEGCGAEIEDDGQLINDKFYDFACCPNCATAEQLKEVEEAYA
jgi:hypothetical protein